MPNIEKSKLLATAQHTIRLEAEALQALADSLDDTTDFQACVETIHRSNGRLVITGIGKSAIVAQKIVATLNSTGQPALFLHAADAIHGDLGMVLPDDVVLCLSKSGESAEVKVLVPLVKNFGNCLIAMTANCDSSLARQADYVLWTPVNHEADPNNLAPTVSTTAQMALGDALAIALLALRGFSTEDFAKFHPGGALGKQLYLRVGELCAMHEAPMVRPEASLQEVILEISSNRLGATAVITDSDEILGIITDGDLRRMLERNMDFSSLDARQIMTPAPKTISAEALAIDALTLMRQHSITQLLVLGTGKYQGIVHLHDLVREGLV